MAGNRGGRRPDPAVDSAVREAVLHLLFERGFDLTFDDVAARAGVGRSTVFRRYPTKRDLILDGFAQLTVEQVGAPDTGSIRDDLLAIVGTVMRVFSEPRLRGLIRRAIGEACRDPAFTDVFRGVLDRRLRLIATVFGRAVERGELPPSTDAALVADLLSGIIVIRLSTDTPLPDPDEVAALVDGLLSGFARRPG